MHYADDELLVRMATAWNRRKMRRTPAVSTARTAVAHLTPAIVITGGSRGIGIALAHRFAAAGYRVAIIARSPEALALAATQITAATHQPVLPIACDITAPDAFAEITRALTDAGLYCDTLVNNAGIGLSGPFAKADEVALGELLALNVTTLTKLCRKALPDMLARQRGGILNIASLGGYAPGPNQAAYYASKSYVLALTEALAVESSGYGVRITVVAPGPVDTDFHASMGAESALYRKLLPSLSAEQVAQAAFRGHRLGLRVVVPHLFNRALLVALKLLPHPLTVPLVGFLLKNRAR